MTTIRLPPTPELEASFAADEHCVFCDQPIVVTPFPSEPPYTSFVTGCPCGKSQGQLKGL